MRKDPTTSTNILLIFLPAFPKRNCNFLPSLLHWERGNRICRLLNTESQLALIPGDPKHHCGPHPSRGLWRSGDQWSFCSSPFHSGPSSFLKFCGYFPSSGMHNWNRYIQQLAESAHLSLTYGMRAIVVEKTKWKPLELPLSRKIGKIGNLM